MHVKARMTAFSGLLLALSVVCMALGSVIETNRGSSSVNSG